MVSLMSLFYITCACSLKYQRTEKSKRELTRYSRRLLSRILSNTLSILLTDAWILIGGIQRFKLVDFFILTALFMKPSLLLCPGVDKRWFDDEILGSLSFLSRRHQKHGAQRTSVAERKGKKSIAENEALELKDCRKLGSVLGASCRKFFFPLSLFAAIKRCVNTAHSVRHATRRPPDPTAPPSRVSRDFQNFSPEADRSGHFRPAC